jgi:hypothetical protein
MMRPLTLALEDSPMRLVCSFLLAVLLLPVGSADAQTLGTFRWQLAPYGSVLNLVVTLRDGLYEIKGFEAQCGGNLSLPVTGLAVPQANGTIFFGLTSITENGRGLHTRAFINTTNFNGTWADNAGNFNEQFLFSPGVTCPGGPRTGPSSPDQGGQGPQ